MTVGDVSQSTTKVKFTLSKHKVKKLSDKMRFTLFLSVRDLSKISEVKACLLMMKDFGF